MNKEFLDKFEETKKKIKELSDDELTKVSGGDNPAGEYNLILINVQFSK